jgi:hypothetical protein
VDVASGGTGLEKDELIMMKNLKEEDGLKVKVVHLSYEKVGSPQRCTGSMQHVGKLLVTACCQYFATSFSGGVAKKLCD